MRIAESGKDRLNSAVNAGMTSTLLKIDLESTLFLKRSFRDSRSLSLYRLLLMNISRIAGSTNIMVVKNSRNTNVVSSQKSLELYKIDFCKTYRNFGIQRISKLILSFQTLLLIWKKDGYDMVMHNVRQHHRRNEPFGV